MPKQPPEILSKEEIDAIVDAAIDDDFYSCLFTLAKKTGRRLGEYWNVRVQDINFENGIMLTQVLKRGKYVMKEAVLDLECLRLLKRLIAVEKLKPEDYVFRKFGYRTIQNAVKRYAKKAGVKKNVMFHNFRHSFVTELHKRGWDYSQIAKLTGHSSIGTLAIYDHSVASDFKEDILKELETM